MVSGEVHCLGVTSANRVIVVGTGFLDAGLYIEPTTVQFDKASIGFWGIPEQTIPQNGYIKLIAPDDIYTYTSDLTCFDVSALMAACLNLNLSLCPSGRQNRGLHSNGLAKHIHRPVES